MQKYKILFAIWFLFFGVYQAQAIGLSVQPSEINASGVLGNDIEVSLKVKNPSRDVLLFEVYPDEFEFLIKANPSSFLLQAGEERSVDLRINSREIGRFETMVSVAAKPLTALSLQPGAGVKVPIHILIGEGNANQLAGVSLIFKDYRSYVVFLAIALLLLAVLGKFRRKKEDA